MDLPMKNTDFRPASELSLVRDETRQVGLEGTFPSRFHRIKSNPASVNLMGLAAPSPAGEGTP